MLWIVGNILIQTRNLTDKRDLTGVLAVGTRGVTCTKKGLMEPFPLDPIHSNTIPKEHVSGLKKTCENNVRL